VCVCVVVVHRSESSGQREDYAGKLKGVGCGGVELN